MATKKSESVSFPQSEVTDEQLRLAADNYLVGTTALRKIIDTHQAFRSVMPPDINPMALPPDLADLMMSLEADEMRLILIVALSNFWVLTLLLADAQKRITDLGGDPFGDSDE